MVKIVHIRKLERLGDHRLKLWFDDATVRTRDFRELVDRVGPMVEPFEDPAYVDRVFLEMGALTWPNGYDWSPEALHADMAAAGVLSRESVAA